MKVTLRSCLFAATLVTAVHTVSAADSTYQETFRPQFHFTPAINWMNDPNGMVYYDGEYHLFYQYNPFGDKWGHMSWGHAVSTDLVHWKHLPVALQEENGVMIFSGSAVVDWKNTSGFGKDGKPPMVAIYTGHYTDHPLQNQNIAFSNDRGRTWTKYEGNPVLDINEANFRDPKVIWHEASGRWVMTVALSNERKVRFYGSPNLKDWSLLSEFGPTGATRGIWECPDLFPVKIEGTDKTKWVLIVNVGGDSIAGGSGCQYFVGNFDGHKFEQDASTKEELSKQPKATRVIADFESGDYDGWQVSGDAFGDAPAAGPLANQQMVWGYEGKGLVNSYRNGDSTTGDMTSAPFEITADHLNFLVGGGRHHGETGLALIVDGKEVRTATGTDDEHLDWQFWDVSDLRGSSAQVKIFDHHTGGWGHINVDQIVLADAAAKPIGDGANWVDYSKDFYAAVSWSDIPQKDGRRIWIGWMSNGQYAGDLPTSPWRSAMSIPRELTLRKIEGKWRLIQSAVKELQTLRDGDAQQYSYKSSGAGSTLQNNFGAFDQPYELVADIKAGDDAKFSFEFFNEGGESLPLSFDLSRGTLTLDRTHCGRMDFSGNFSSTFTAPVRRVKGAVRIHAFVDTSSIEIFVNDGEEVLTSLVFPNGGVGGLRLKADEGVQSVQTKTWKLKSAWR